MCMCYNLINRLVNLVKSCFLNNVLSPLALWSRNTKLYNSSLFHDADINQNLITSVIYKLDFKHNRLNLSNYSCLKYRILHKLSFHTNFYQTSSRISLLTEPLASLITCSWTSLITVYMYDMITHVRLIVIP